MKTLAERMRGRTIAPTQWAKAFGGTKAVDPVAVEDGLTTFDGVKVLRTTDGAIAAGRLALLACLQPLGRGSPRRSPTMTTEPAECPECGSQLCRRRRALAELNRTLERDLGVFTDRASRADKSARERNSEAIAECRARAFRKAERGPVPLSNGPTPPQVVDELDDGPRRFEDWCFATGGGVASSPEVRTDDAGAMSGPHAGRADEDGTRAQPEEPAGQANPVKSEVGND